MIEAFSIDTLSAGSPSPFQIALSDGVARTSNGSIPSVIGIYLSLISGIHFSCQSSFLNVKLNGPIYETKADATRASPIVVSLSCTNVLTLSYHLVFSSANPLTSLLARLSFY